MIRIPPISGRISRPLERTGFYLMISIILLAFVFPFIWMILASLKTQADIIAVDRLFIFTPTLDNYREVLAGQKFPLYIMNSLIIGVGATLAALALGLPAAFAIARYGLKKLALVVLLVKIIPGITFLIPWFTLFSKIHMIDTYPALILAHMLVALPYIVWIMIPFFESMPVEIQESSLIDGCSPYQMFRKIVLPISAPGAITCSLLSFIHSWNNFLFSLVLSGNKTKTLPVAIFNFLTDAEINWGGVMTAACIIMTPVVIVSLLSQRYIVSGLSAGAVKG